MAPIQANPRPKGKAILVDLDGTLNTFPQTPENQSFNWNRTDCPIHAQEASQRMMNNEPNRPIVQLVQLLYASMPADCILLICTARPELYRSATEEWLRRHQINHHDVFMRFNGDLRSDCDVKRDMLMKIRKRFEPWFVIEDRASVASMWRSEGVTCLHCADGNY